MQILFKYSNMYLKYLEIKYSFSNILLFLFLYLLFQFYHEKKLINVYDQNEAFDSIYE